MHISAACYQDMGFEGLVVEILRMCMEAGYFLFLSLDDELTATT